MSAPISRQLLTSIADYHQLLLVSTRSAIRAVVLLPEHPYYQYMVPTIEQHDGDPPQWEVTYRNFWGHRCWRSFNTGDEAKLFIELLLKPLVIEHCDIWPRQGLRLADIADADRIWRDLRLAIHKATGDAA